MMIFMRFRGCSRTELVCVLAAAGEGPGFDPACAECCVVVCGVPVDTFPGFLSTAGMFPGRTSQWKLCASGSTSKWRLLTVAVVVVVEVVSQSCC